MIRNTEFTLLTTDSSQDSQERPETRDERAEFDDMYHDKAEEHDQEFIGGYGDDLNNTLIFVGFFPVYMHQEKGRQLIYLSRLFCLIPCHLDASKMSKHGLGLYNANN